MLRIKKTLTGIINFDTIAMSDVALVLLEFFLLSSKFKDPNMLGDILLPSSNSSAICHLHNGKIVYIYINGEKEISLNLSGKPLFSNHVHDYNSLKAFLKNINDYYPKPQNIIIVGDKNVPYHTIHQVINSLQEIGINRFSVLTEHKDSGLSFKKYTQKAVK